MPRNPETEPKVDWLRALVLERMADKELSQKDLAERTHYGYYTVRKNMMHHPHEWSRDFRNAVFRTLGISVKRLPDQVQQEILLYQVGE